MVLFQAKLLLMKLINAFYEMNKINKIPIKFFFATIAHKRLKPIIHKFKYESLYISIPIKSTSESYGNWLIGINRPAIISVNKKDHGIGVDFYPWISEILADNNITKKVSEIWLSTFPKIFGFGFKPVSFWFCEDVNKKLIAVVAEVNNTFGDRKCYFLSNKNNEIKNGSSLFSSKEFYVSPFINIEGDYHFKFYRDDVKKIESVSIDLENNKNTSLKTSISCKEFEFNSFAKIFKFFIFLLSPIFTITRINWQALKLWTKGVKLVKKNS